MIKLVEAKYLYFSGQMKLKFLKLEHPQFILEVIAVYFVQSKC